MKKQIPALLLTVCIGISLLTGCANGGVKNNALDNQVSSPQSTQGAAQSPSNSEGEISKKESAGTPANDSEDIASDTSSLSANDLFKSADLMGTVTEHSDSGCTVDKITITEDTQIPGGSVTIVYKDNIIFEAGTFKSDGNSPYSLKTCDIARLSKGAFVLVFGSLQDDDTYSATKIIIAEFD